MVGIICGKETVKMENGNLLYHLYLQTEFSDYKKEQGAVGYCTSELWTGLEVASRIKVSDKIQFFYDKNGKDKDGKDRYKLSYLEVVK